MDNEEKYAVDLKSLEVRDDGSAPTLYVDGIHGISILDGVVVMNLTRTTIATPGGQMPDGYIDTVTRLALPVGAFLRFEKFMSDQVQKMKADGIVVEQETKNVASASE